MKKTTGVYPAFTCLSEETEETPALARDLMVQQVCGNGREGFGCEGGRYIPSGLRQNDLPQYRINYFKGLGHY